MFNLLHPLTLFPQLLPYGLGSYFFAPTILRIAVATVFIYLAIVHFKNKKEVSAEIPWVSHEMKVWITGIYILAELAAGAQKAKMAMGGIQALAELGLVDPLRANLFMDQAFAGTNDRAKMWAWEILCLESWAQARCKV